MNTHTSKFMNNSMLLYVFVVFTVIGLRYEAILEPWLKKKKDSKTKLCLTLGLILQHKMFPC